jgi:subtilisin family serine protease
VVVYRSSDRRWHAPESFRTRCRDRGAGSTADVDGHGTGMAGIIAARGGGANSIRGVAPRAKIPPVRIATKDNGSSDAINDGIRWAADQGAKVINLSFRRRQRSAEHDGRRGGVRAQQGRGRRGRCGQPSGGSP